MAKKTKNSKATKKSAKKAAKKMTKKPVKKAAPSRAKAAPKKPTKPAAKPKAASGFDGLAVSITVNDVARSLAFYRDVVGFEVGQKWEMEGQLRGAELTSGKAYVMIGQDDWQKGRDRKKGEACRFYLMTSQDIDAMAAKLKARGLVLDQEPTVEAWGHFFSFSDPDGFKLTIFKEKK